MAEIKGYLSLIGDCIDLSKVSKMIPRAPTWQREKSEVLGNGRMFGHCEWGVETETILSNDLSTIENTIANLLPCPREELAEIACCFDSEWSILFLIRVSNEFPVLSLSSDFIKFAADINASIGFDVYQII